LLPDTLDAKVAIPEKYSISTRVEDSSENNRVTEEFLDSKRPIKSQEVADTPIEVGIVDNEVVAEFSAPEEIHAFAPAKDERIDAEQFVQEVVDNLPSSDSYIADVVEEHGPDKGIDSVVNIDTPTATERESGVDSEDNRNGGGLLEEFASYVVEAKESIVQLQQPQGDLLVDSPYSLENSQAQVDLTEKNNQLFSDIQDGLQDLKGKDKFIQDKTVHALETLLENDSLSISARGLNTNSI
jgi:hypothetical protein